MEYKVGDKVRVRSDLVVNEEYGGETFEKPMERFSGKIVTISATECSSFVNYKCEHHIKEDVDEWYFSNEMLEPLD